jgi:hypothetical protein
LPKKKMFFNEFDYFGERSSGTRAGVVYRGARICNGSI